MNADVEAASLLPVGVAVYLCTRVCFPGHALPLGNAPACVSYLLKEKLAILSPLCFSTAA